MLYRSTTYPLATLVHDIKSGAIGLPELQRPFVWPNAKIRDLFDSLYRGYPRDIEAELKALQDKARQLKSKQKAQLGELLRLPRLRRHAARRLAAMWERDGTAAFSDFTASLLRQLDARPPDV